MTRSLEERTADFYLRGLLLLVALVAAPSASAEWWWLGFNGHGNHYVNAGAIASVERPNTKKVWDVFVPESLAKKQAKPGPKGGSDESRVVKVLYYIDCENRRSNVVQVATASRKDGRPLLTNSYDQDIGFKDIDPDSILSTIADVTCSSDPIDALKKYGAEMLTDDDYLTNSDIQFQYHNWQGAKAAAIASGRPVPKPPASVISYYKSHYGVKEAREEAPAKEEAPSAPAEESPAAQANDIPAADATFADCILSRIQPGMSDVAAAAITAACREKYGPAHAPVPSEMRLESH